MAPQVIVLALMGMSVCAAAYLHGKPKTGEHNFLVEFINNALTFGLLWWGGFFSGFGG